MALVGFLGPEYVKNWLSIYQKLRILKVGTFLQSKITRLKKTVARFLWSDYVTNCPSINKAKFLLIEYLHFVNSMVSWFWMERHPEIKNDIPFFFTWLSLTRYLEENQSELINSILVCKTGNISSDTWEKSLINFCLKNV